MSTAPEALVADPPSGTDAGDGLIGRPVCLVRASSQVARIAPSDVDDSGDTR